MKWPLLNIMFLPLLLFSQSDSLSKKHEQINWIKHNLNSPKQKLWSSTILPLSLGFTSLSLNQKTTKLNLQNQVLKPFNGYSNHIDDYIQYAPIGIMYGADLFKFKAEHSIWNQTKFLFMSEAITGVIVLSLKYGLKYERPDGSSLTAYPSGHTAQAFVASQVLYIEFKHTNKVLAYSGYLFSVPTGALRVINNRHWVPDVLLGAGIGILVTNFIYYFEPLKKWTPNFFIRNKDLTFRAYPTISEDFVGANFKLKL
jgi:hypothetical protein